MPKLSSSKERAWHALRQALGTQFDPLVAVARNADKLEKRGEYRDAGELYGKLLPFVYQKLSTMELAIDPDSKLPVALIDMTGVFKPNRKDPIDDLVG